ncbi:MAG: mandelate racemase/muconate lactonizing enzyme family protein [Deltaproteobacteria bacterium]|nr:mandelate racemase/muconate lactonizing enzyme family protein [Deltaproteobacteria bacterium]
MKIVKIEVFILEKKLSSSMCISRGGFTVRNHVIVQVETDSGITGLGEGIGNARYIKGILEERMNQLAIGMNPLAIETLRQKLLDSQVYFECEGSAICAASAIEMACWDIKGKALNCPVYQLLGGLHREKLELYASDVYWEEDPKRMSQSAKRIMDQGIHSIKAHIGFRDAREDLRRVEALRNTLDSKDRLMIDLNAGYQFSEALSATKLWNEFDLYWLEEPLHPQQVRRCSELRAKSSIPIAGGENIFRTYGFRNLFEQGALDFAMPDIGRAGGLQETKNICALAEAYGVEVSPHNFSSGVLLAATMHLMAATPNTNLLEFDTSENAIYHEFFVEPLKIKDGTVCVPHTPGLGVHLSPDIVKRYAVS